MKICTSWRRRGRASSRVSYSCRKELREGAFRQGRIGSAARTGRRPCRQGEARGRDEKRIFSEGLCGDPFLWRWNGQRCLTQEVFHQPRSCEKVFCINNKSASGFTIAQDLGGNSRADDHAGPRASCASEFRVRRGNRGCSRWCAAVPVPAAPEPSMGAPEASIPQTAMTPTWSKAGTRHPSCCRAGASAPASPLDGSDRRSVPSAPRFPPAPTEARRTAGAGAQGEDDHAISRPDAGKAFGQCLPVAGQGEDVAADLHYLPRQVSAQKA